ncbi:MAG: hypothetical protein HY267_00500 [Deltaproteobacteria bacterium]|nr:hypothetical protein [Deltaproteobacteria bacterium]
MGQQAPSLEVPLASLIELAVESWRLRCWLSDSTVDQSKVPVRYVARRLDQFLKEREIEALDLVGQPYEPGLAVDVVDVISDTNLPEGPGVIAETVAPIVLWRGAVVKHGQIVTRRRTADDTNEKR